MLSGEFGGEVDYFIPWDFPLHEDKSIQGSSEKAERAFQEKYSVIYNHLWQHKEKLSKRNKAEAGIRYGCMQCKDVPIPTTQNLQKKH